MMAFLEYEPLIPPPNPPPHSLDPRTNEYLHSKPIYGLIFLFRWREDDANKQEATCPDGIWFANQVCLPVTSQQYLCLELLLIRAQTASNACASVALLNIVNNIPGIDLGENLRHFKEFTMPFTPALRGDAINNFEFVKRVHNSFARYARLPHRSPRDLRALLTRFLFFDFVARWTFSTLISNSRWNQKHGKSPPRVRVTTIPTRRSISLRSCRSWARFGSLTVWSDSLN